MVAVMACKVLPVLHVKVFAGLYSHKSEYLLKLASVPVAI